MKLKRIKYEGQENIKVVCDVCGCNVFAFGFGNNKTFYCANCGKEQYEVVEDEKEENGIPVELAEMVPDKCDVCGGELEREKCDVCGCGVFVIYRGKLVCEKCGKVHEDLIQKVLDNL